jgi:hypothetical protein
MCRCPRRPAPRSRLRREELNGRLRRHSWPLRGGDRSCCTPASLRNSSAKWNGPGMNHQQRRVRRVPNRQLRKLLDDQAKLGRRRGQLRELLVLPRATHVVVLRDEHPPAGPGVPQPRVIEDPATKRSVPATVTTSTAACQAPFPRNPSQTRLMRTRRPPSMGLPESVLGCMTIRRCRKAVLEPLRDRGVRANVGHADHRIEQQGPAVVRPAPRRWSRRWSPIGKPGRG